MDYTSLVKEVNIPELVKALRLCVTKGDLITICDGCPYKAEIGVDCENNLHKDAAAAIEALQAEVERLQVDLDAAWALMEVQDG